MTEVTTNRFTVGVFQDVEWAERGIDALRRHEFAPEALTIIAKESPEADALVRRVTGADGTRLEVKGIGPAIAVGSLVPALQGADAALAKKGLAAVMKRAGFQAHDGQIYETLTSRGGVLVAIEDERRAADALATLHAYGGGNAAIGAWTGRV